MNGTNQSIVVDGGITPLESTLATLAHEIFHANDSINNPYFVAGDPAKEARAETQGFLAERAFMDAVRAGY
jgi:hypothetical protein